MRLFCFPFAGGGASVYASWARALPATVELCAVELPGRERRLSEPPHRSFETLIPALAEGLAPLLDLPFTFFGHSLGALVAFELATHLEDAGRAGPQLLHASACPAPSHAAWTRGPISALDEAALIEELRRMEGTPAAVLEHRELLELALPSVRADFALCETYQPRLTRKLRGSILALGGAEDLSVNPRELAAWGAHCEGPCRVRMLPGGHFFLQDSRDLLLRQLSQDLQGLRLHRP